MTRIDQVDVLAQADGNPAKPDRLSLTWVHLDETLISPDFTLTVPSDLPTGEYRLLIGLYNYQTGVRLPVYALDNPSGVDGAFQLQTFSIDR